MERMVASAFLNPLCQRLINAVIDTALDEYALVRGVKEEIGKLGETVRLIEDVLQDAEGKQETEAAVRTWHGTLKQILYDAEDVLDEVATNAALQARDSTELAVSPASTVRRMRAKVRNIICCFGTIDNISADREIAHQIKTIRERLDEKSRERETLGLQRLGGSSMPRQKRPETSALLYDASHVIGRDVEKKKLMELLLGSGEEPAVEEIRGGTSRSRKNVHVITIVGMGGVGKTTLARVAYNEPTVKEHFQLRAWVCISNDFDVARITKEIIDAVSDANEGSRGLTNEVLNWDKTHGMLKTKLEGKRFLLVLDDMWEEDHSEWERLSVPFMDGAEGSRIVVTTRKMKVSNIIKGTRIELKNLPSEDLWSVFERYAFDGCDPNKHKQLETISREIVEKLQGSPLAAKTVGRLLNANPDVMHWESVKDSKIWVRSQQGENGILPILKLSYDYLPGHLKQCFAYCSLFPADYRFVKDELVQLWMAQNFIQVPRGDHVGEVLREHFDSLLHASFFEQRGHAFVMHDLIHELAESIYEDEYFRYEDSKSNKMNEKKRHLSVATHNLDPSVLKQLCEHGNLRTLLLQGWRINVDLTSHLDGLFMKLKRLRVLVLRRCTMQQLPDSIGDLKHLRYVDISYTKISKLPESIRNLHNLEVLDLWDCKELSSLPSNMCALVNLRLLKFSRPFEFNGLGKLTALEEIRVRGGKVRELAEMRMLQDVTISSLEEVESKEEAIQAKLGSKKHLRVLQLGWSHNRRHSSVEEQGTDEEEVLECLQPAKCIRRLNIYYNLGAKPPSWLRDGSSWLSSSSLESVELRGCDNWQVLPALGQLPCLKYLSIGKMKSLKDMGGEFQYSHFPSLEELFLYDLPELVKWEVPWPPHEQHDDGDHDDRPAQHQLSLLPRLRQLRITECPLLRQLPPPPPLQKLEIRNVGLTSLSASEWFPSSSSPALASLHIRACPNLTSLTEWFGHLASLTTLEVIDCPLLTHLPPLPPSLQKLEIRNVGLTSLSASGWLPPSSSPALASLHIRACPNLTSLTEGFGHLASLTTLEVTDCPKLSWLTSAPMKDALPSFLQEIFIDACTETKDLLSTDPDQRLTSVTSLQIKYDMPSTSSSPLISPQPPPASKFLRLKILEISRSSPEQIKVWLLHCLSLEELTIKRCPLLKSFHGDACNGTGTGLDLALLNLAPTLRNLEFRHCENLGSLPSKLNRLSALKSLRIDACPILECLPSAGLPESLQSLRIWKCPELLERCKEGGPDWPLVCRIPNLHVS